MIVSYNPEKISFTDLLIRLCAQVNHIFIVDNSSQENNDVFHFCQDCGIDCEKFSLIRLGDNFGVAFALNVGIQEAMLMQANFILLSDQDSLPDEHMVCELLRAYKTLTAMGIRVGVIGPTYTDLFTGLTYPFQVKLPGKFFYGHQVATKDIPHVESLTLITSGSLIPSHVFQSVGLMRDDLFIDMVDCEWCHRARWRGYRVFGTGWAKMHQRMGEHRLRIWYLRWRYESAYSPLRIYYRMRNFVALWRPHFIDWRWKVRSSWYGLGIVYAHVFFSNYPLETLKMFAKGVWHGLRGKMGRYPG